jgi:hypothetical protein
MRQRQPRILEAAPEDADREVRASSLRIVTHRRNRLALQRGNIASIQFGHFSGKLRACPSPPEGHVRQIQNPPNPFESVEREWLEAPPTCSSSLRRARQIDPERELEPRLGLSLEHQPYRGCFHACAYCYARPTHEYSGFGSGTDFESKIVVKTNAPELPAHGFMQAGWQGELIAFLGQHRLLPAARSGLAADTSMPRTLRRVPQPGRHHHEIGLVQRDLDVLQRLHERASVDVYFSIPFADDATAARSSRRRRSCRAVSKPMRRLASAGIRTGVSIAPIIPGLTTTTSLEISSAPATPAPCTLACLLPLPGNVRDGLPRTAFAPRCPARRARCENRIRDVRNGC